MNLLFENLTILNPEEGSQAKKNLWIKEDRIEAISTKPILPENDTQIIDATGFFASAGFFDMHVHFREPGYEYKEDIDSGILSAANGGFTGVVVMPNTKPAIDSREVLQLIHDRSKNKIVDVFSSCCITKKMEGKDICDFDTLAEAGGVLFTDDGKCVTNSKVMREAFMSASEKDYLISQHCEDTQLTGDFDMNESEVSKKLGLKGYPSIAEELILIRDILLAEECGNRRYHAQHISTKNAVEIIRNAKSKGLRVSAEVTPHHFTLHDRHLCGYDTNYKMNPPLREDEDITALKEGLKDGTIDAIATDHAPHSKVEKENQFHNAPNGILGLETAFGLSYTFLVLDGYLTLNGLVEKLSVNPRKLLGLPKVKIEEGEIANLTIFDPDEEWIVDLSKFKSKSRNSPFGGMKLFGKVKYTINNGVIFISEL